MLVLVSIVISGFCLPEMPDSSEYVSVNVAALSGVMGAVLTCFSAHAAIPSICAQANPQARKSFWKVSGVSFGVATVVYLFCGVVGYYFFAHSTQPDLAENIAMDIDMRPIPGLAPLRVALSSLLVVKLQVSFPLFSTPLLDTVEAAVFHAGERRLWPRLALRVLFVGVTTCMAIVLREKMMALLNFGGCFFIATTSVIFPALFYMILHRDRLPIVQQLLLGAIAVGGIYIQVTGTWAAVDQFLVR